MLLIFILFPSFGFNILYEHTENSNLVIQVAFEVETVFLSKSQLIVIVIQTLLRNSNNGSSLL